VYKVVASDRDNIELTRTVSGFDKPQDLYARANGWDYLPPPVD
jgi:hypothetical protein